MIQKKIYHTNFSMGEELKITGKRTFLCGIVCMNILLTLGTIGLFGFSMHSLNNRVHVLEAKLKFSTVSKGRTERSLDRKQENLLKSCGACRQICINVLGRNGKVIVSIVLCNTNLDLPRTKIFERVSSKFDNHFILL